MPLPLDFWRTSTGVVMTATGATNAPAILPQAGSASPAPMVMKMIVASTSACKACFDGRIPGDFNPTPPTEASVALDYDLHLLVPMRVVEATALEAAHTLSCTFSWGTPGVQGRALTAITKAYPAFVSDNTTDATGAIGFGILDFDIGAEIAAEIVAGTITGTPPYVTPRDWFQAVLAPVTTLNASAYLELFSPTLVYRATAGLWYAPTGTAGINLGTNFRSVRGGGGA
jgi:hypothetical protein